MMQMSKVNKLFIYIFWIEIFCHYNYKKIHDIFVESFSKIFKSILFQIYCYFDQKLRSKILKHFYPNIVCYYVLLLLLKLKKYSSNEINSTIYFFNVSIYPVNTYIVYTWSSLKVWFEKNVYILVLKASSQKNLFCLMILLYIYFHIRLYLSNGLMRTGGLTGAFTLPFFNFFEKDIKRRKKKDDVLKFYFGAHRCIWVQVQVRVCMISTEGGTRVFKLKLKK